MIERFFPARAMLMLLIFGLQTGLTGVCQNRSVLIGSIKKEFSAINRDSTLRTKTLSGEDFLPEAYDGGAELTGYYRHDSLVKLVEWIGFSLGNRIREFYFQRGQLCFAFVQFRQFPVNDSTREMRHDSTITRFEGRYYFDAGKLLQTRRTGRPPMSKDPDEIGELKRAAEEYRKRLGPFFR